MYLIGKITRTHGIKGEVKVQNLSDFNRFFIGATLILKNGDTDLLLEIETIRPQNKVMLIKFKGFDNLNDVLFMQGKQLFSKSIAHENLDSDDYHYDLIIGLDVYVDDKKIGEVSGIIEVPQGHILEITTNDKKKLVPFVKEFVTDIDDEKIIISPIEGLL